MFAARVAQHLVIGVDAVYMMNGFSVATALPRMVQQRSFLQTQPAAVHSHAVAERLLAVHRGPKVGRDHPTTSNLIIPTFSSSEPLVMSVMHPAVKVRYPAYLTAVAAELSLAVEAQEPMVAAQQRETVGVFPQLLRAASELLVVHGAELPCYASAAESIVKGAAQFVHAIRQAPQPLWFRDAPSDMVTGLRILAAEHALYHALAPLLNPHQQGGRLDLAAMDLEADKAGALVGLGGRWSMLHVAESLRQVTDPAMRRLPVFRPATEFYPGTEVNPGLLGTEEITQPSYAWFEPLDEADVVSADCMLGLCIAHGIVGAHERVSSLAGRFPGEGAGESVSLARVMSSALRKAALTEAGVVQTLRELVAIARPVLAQSELPWSFRPHIAGYLDQLEI